MYNTLTSIFVRKPCHCLKKDHTGHPNRSASLSFDMRESDALDIFWNEVCTNEQTHYRIFMFWRCTLTVGATRGKFVI